MKGRGLEICIISNDTNTISVAKDIDFSKDFQGAKKCSQI